jgi:hypothetical protein
MSKGRERGQNPEPVEQAALPAELATFLRSKDVACMMQETTKGTVFVVKLPGSEIESLPGRIPIHIRHELYEHPFAPVIRTVIRIFDRPDNPLGLETFTNVEQEDQRADFVRLARQGHIYMLFYDENLNHRLTKGMDNVEPDVIYTIIETADAIRTRIPVERYDFDRAKADVLAGTSL